MELSAAAPSDEAVFVCGGVTAVFCAVVGSVEVDVTTRGRVTDDAACDAGPDDPGPDDGGDCLFDFAGPAEPVLPDLGAVDFAVELEVLVVVWSVAGCPPLPFTARELS